LYFFSSIRADVYLQNITLKRFNIRLTQDAIRLLDQIVTAFNNTFADITTIEQLEAKIRSIFPPATADTLVPQLYNAARRYVSQEQTVIEAKNITVRYAITLILRAVAQMKPGQLIDVYDIATIILQTFRAALPKFPYGRANEQIQQSILANGTTVLAGFMTGVEDYLVALQERLSNLTPQQLVLLGQRYGFQTTPRNIL
jgi:hypothetical protein